jgi:AraC-like DNA-binding protein
VIKNELSISGFKIKKVELGKVELFRNLSETDVLIIKKILINNGFELIEDRKGSLVEKIKSEIDNYIVQDKSFPDKTDNLSKHLSTRIGYEYSYLSSLFSSIEGTTIEKHLIHRKIDRVKELLVYDELTLGDIAFKLGYNSTQYLSNQFKKITGLTPTYFKKVKERKSK